MKSIFVIGLVLLSGCHRSGTWIDSPGNWNRAFNSRKPLDVVVVHSKYWRSPHWTYEFEYFFQIRSNAMLAAQLMTRNNLVQIDGTNAINLMEQYFGEKPDWFIPRGHDAYETWIYDSEPRGNFRVFVDKQSHDMFLSDNQI